MPSIAKDNAMAYVGERGRICERDRSGNIDQWRKMRNTTMTATEIGTETTEAKTKRKRKMKNNLSYSPDLLFFLFPFRVGFADCVDSMLLFHLLLSAC